MDVLTLHLAIDCPRSGKQFLTICILLFKNVLKNSNYYKPTCVCCLYFHNKSSYKSKQYIYIFYLGYILLNFVCKKNKRGEDIREK